jgi:hypothetical protein
MKKKGTQRTFASKRSMNAGHGNTGTRKAFQQHDPKRRLGSFASTGEHPRTGNRGHE